MHDCLRRMKRVTVSLDERDLYELEARQRLGEAESRSDAVRQILQEYEELNKEYEQLKQDYEDLHNRYEAREDRVDELESQLRKRSNIEQKIEDLPDKIRDYGTYTERRQRKLDQATVSQRLKWKFTGVPVDEDE